MNPITSSEFFRSSEIASEAIGLSISRGSKCCFVEFDSPGDMVRAAKIGLARGDHQFNHMTDAEWIGRKFNDFDDVVAACDTNWAEGVDRVEEMVHAIEREDLPRPTVIKRRRVWDEFAGDEIDVDRYRAADPYFRTNARLRTPGPRVITMLTQINQNGGATSEQIFWRGALTVALARIVEDAGYRTEISAFVLSERCLANYHVPDYAMALRLKSADNPLDIGGLVNATSGWFFRTVEFASRTATGRTLNEGLGRMREAGRATCEFLAPAASPWLIGGVYDMASAVRLARQLLQTLVIDSRSP